MDAKTGPSNWPSLERNKDCDVAVVAYYFVEGKMNQVRWMDAYKRPEDARQENSMEIN